MSKGKKSKHTQTTAPAPRAARPDDAEAHFKLGEACKTQGQLEQALGYYRRTVELQPDHAVAHNNLANILKTRGQLEPAIDH